MKTEINPSSANLREDKLDFMREFWPDPALSYQYLRILLNIHLLLN
jgi:hypothetical protein